MSMVVRAPDAILKIKLYHLHWKDYCPVSIGFINYVKRVPIPSQDLTQGYLLYQCLCTPGSGLWNQQIRERPLHPYKTLILILLGLLLQRLPNLADHQNHLGSLNSSSEGMYWCYGTFIFKKKFSNILVISQVWEVLSHILRVTKLSLSVFITSISIY